MEANSKKLLRRKIIAQKIIAQEIRQGLCKCIESCSQLINALTSVANIVWDNLYAHTLDPNTPVSISKQPIRYTSTYPEYHRISFRMHVQLIYSALPEVVYYKRLQGEYIDQEKHNDCQMCYLLSS